MIGKAASNNPSFLTLRRLEAVRDISQSIANSGNRIILSTDTLLLDALSDKKDNKKNEI